MERLVKPVCQRDDRVMVPDVERGHVAYEAGIKAGHVAGKNKNLFCFRYLQRGIKSPQGADAAYDVIMGGKAKIGEFPRVVADDGDTVNCRMYGIHHVFDEGPSAEHE